MSDYGKPVTEPRTVVKTDVVITYQHYPEAVREAARLVGAMIGTYGPRILEREKEEAKKA